MARSFLQTHLVRRRCVPLCKTVSWFPLTLFSPIPHLSHIFRSVTADVYKGTSDKHYWNNFFESIGALFLSLSLNGGTRLGETGAHLIALVVGVTNRKERHLNINILFNRMNRGVSRRGNWGRYGFVTFGIAFYIGKNPHGRGFLHRISQSHKHLETTVGIHNAMVIFVSPKGWTKWQRKYASSGPWNE